MSALRPLVQKEYATGGRPRPLARPRDLTAVDQPRSRDGVMWGAEWAASDQGRTPIGQAGDAMDTGGVEGFGHRHGGLGGSAHGARFSAHALGAQVLRCPSPLCRRITADHQALPGISSTPRRSAFFLGCRRSNTTLEKPMVATGTWPCSRIPLCGLPPQRQVPAALRRFSHGGRDPQLVCHRTAAKIVQCDPARLDERPQPP
jgi:hypothetical protein